MGREVGRVGAVATDPRLSAGRDKTQAADDTMIYHERTVTTQQILADRDRETIAAAAFIIEIDKAMNWRFSE